MNRRHFIQTSGLSLASILLSNAGNLYAGIPGTLINLPDSVSAMVNGQLLNLSPNGRNIWTANSVSVELKDTANSMVVEAAAPGVQLSFINLQWKTPVNATASILNDQWERTYGDASWHKPAAAELLPWYFMEYNGKVTNGFGIRTGASSFGAWQLKEEKLHLVLDTRSGGEGVELGQRKLKAAEIVTIKGNEGETPFQTARRFMKMMCPEARMPKQPVYGINDWYFTYGNNSEKLIIEHTEMMAPMAEGLIN